MTAWEFISLILKQAELRKSQRFVETQARFFEVSSHIP